MLQNNKPTNPYVSVRDVSSIRPYLQEVHNQNSSRVVESIQKLIHFYLGSPETDGNLYRFGNEYSNYEPL